jgi:cobalt-zinc-cadmium efflux system outer membrane protein
VDTIRRSTFLVLFALGACAASTQDFGQPFVSSQIEARTGHALAQASVDLPPDCDLDDGATVDEAVALALWRNADFAAALAELDLRRSDLVEAGLLPNPMMAVLFPLGPKQFEFVAKVPLEALWLRERRIVAAEFDYERTANQLVGSGLDLIATVREAFADLELATQRIALARERAVLREQLSEFDAARLRNGDASALEAVLARGELSQARALVFDAELARDNALEQLRALLSLEQELPALQFVSEPQPQSGVPLDVATCVELAMAARPDVRALELALEAAGERAGLARDEYMTISALLDANGSGTDGFEAGPGIEMPLPIFQRGEIAGARADAELRRAMKQYVALRQRVQLEVRAAHIALARAVLAREAADETLQWLGAARDGAAVRSRGGETGARPLLEAELSRLDGRMRAAQAETQLRKSRARLERAVGRSLE